MFEHYFLRNQAYRLKQLRAQSVDPRRVAMTDIPEDIMKAAKEVAEIVTDCGCEGCQTGSSEEIGKAILAERERCLSIVKAIETRNPSEAHLIETIVRRLRGDE